MKDKIILSKIVILLIFVVLTITSSNLNWTRDDWKGILKSDAKGYYAYLPAVFIYQDLNFSFFDKVKEEKKQNEYLYYDYRTKYKNKVINKYYCGTGIAELPFFFVAHALSAMLGFETNGYSKLYPIFINIAALFYLLIGLIFLDKILNFYNINEKEKLLTLIAAIFGTNLFYYIVVEPGMSHIYSFAFVSMFLYFSKEYFISPQKKYILILAAVLGIIVLIRPINGLIIFLLPFAAGNFEALKNGIQAAFQYYKTLLIAMGCFFAIIFIQLILYKIATGDFMVYAYGEERFYFLSPHIMDILFSYRKGLFLYTPMYLIALGGAYFLWKERRFECCSLIIFLTCITYIFSCWESWFYGGSFSSRVYIEYIPLFMIPLALAINRIKLKNLKLFYISSIFLLIALCQFQTYQYRYHIIHWSEMTKEKYWEVFLKV